MGTNYYVESGTCKHCGHKSERLHIGKSSAGWKFCFQTNEQYGLFTAAQWEDFLVGKIIVDEYNRESRFPEFWGLVIAKQDGLDLNTATDSQYGCPRDRRDRMEYLDPQGYRFCNVDFS